MVLIADTDLESLENSPKSNTGINKKLSYSKKDNYHMISLTCEIK